jgi:hypothetical protein
LLQREIEQGLTRHLYLVAPSDDFRACAGACADARADRCSLAAVGCGADDRSKSRSADVLFAVLAPRDLPVASYSPVTTGTIFPFTTIPVSSRRSCDLPVNVPDSFACVSRP